MSRILVAIAILLVTVSCVNEIPMVHRERTPREAKMFIAYMNRDPIIENVMKVIGSLFPGKTPNIYAYPEVKITNYMDAQYYG